MYHHYFIVTVYLFTKNMQKLITALKQIKAAGYRFCLTEQNIYIYVH